MYQLLHLLLGHFLSEACQEVAQFNGRDSIFKIGLVSSKISVYFAFVFVFVVFVFW